MTTISIRELKAEATRILRHIEKTGEVVVITRRGTPCGLLTPIKQSSKSKKSLRSIRNSFSKLPNAEYQDFLNIKGIWEPGALPDDE